MFEPYACYQTSLERAAINDRLDRMKPILAVLALCLANFAFAQDAPPVAPEPAAKSILEVRLTPHVPTETESLRWSPKGATIELTKENDALIGTLEFAIEENPRKGRGYTPKPSDGQRKFSLRLTRSKDAAHFDQLWIGAGSRDVGKTLTTTPSESRGKFWSSFETTLGLPAASVQGMRTYPLSFWFVEDPLEPDAAPALRWSRRGWHAGEVKLGDETIYVLITEMQMDGVFDDADAWSLSSDQDTLVRKASSRSLGRHAWLGERAFRMTDLDPNGMWIRFEAFDPGVTRAEEEAAEDLYAADRNAKRALAPLAFGHDFEAALAQAKREGKRLLVDFETTWCGPCKQMDGWVYTAAKVVDAAKAGNVIAVKVDGDDHPELKKRFGVEAFPTMILLDAEGTELGRNVGYTGVDAMAAFLQLVP